jgi:Protein of unknown function (DUF2510)
MEQRPGWEPSPGWYLDPADGRGERFWDGSHWTQQTRGARTRIDWRGIVGLLAFLVVLGGGFELWGRAEEHRLRPGLQKTLDQVIVPAELRLVSEDYSGNSWCLDACPTLTRRYSSPLTRQETYQVFAAELERLGYRCVRYCGEVDASADAWAQPSKQSPEISLQVRFTTDLDEYGGGGPKDASRPVHADLSVQ